jgi:DNA-binding MarR family transcriptional regulator
VSASATGLADEAWALMASFFFRLGGRHMAEAVRLTGLNPGAVKALQSLAVDEPKSMRALAEEWACDASNVTWLVDRLEERGLVRRRTSPTDRRVKTVVLTKAGVRMQSKIAEIWSEAPDQLRALADSDLAELIEVFRRLQAI